MSPFAQGHVQLFIIAPNNTNEVGVVEAYRGLQTKTNRLLVNYSFNQMNHGEKAPLTSKLEQKSRQLPILSRENDSQVN